jgi:hypothetical protein
VPAAGRSLLEDWPLWAAVLALVVVVGAMLWQRRA